MSIIGEILELSVEDGQVICRVQTGTNQEVSAILLLPLGVDSYPLIGDSVLCHSVGAEWVAVAGDSGHQNAESGEIIIFSRDSSNNPKTTLILRASSERVEIGNGSLSVAISENLKALWTQMKTIAGTHTHTVMVAGSPVTSSPPSTQLPDYDDGITSETMKISG